MTPEPPEWRPYDPDDPSSEVAPVDDCSFVVLLATSAARSDGWAGRAAVALARRWARAGRLILVDLGLTSPVLHQLVGRDNHEGISDLLLYGASLGRVAREVEEGFFLTPAGTPVPDSRAVLARPDWDGLPGRVKAEAARVLLFLPSDEPGCEAVLGRAERVLILAGEGETNALSAAPGETRRVSDVLWPGRGAEAPADSATLEKGPAPPPLVTGSADGSAEADAPARLSGPILAGTGAEAAPRPARETKRRSRAVLGLTAAVLLAALLGVLVALGVVRLPLVSGGAPPAPGGTASPAGGAPAPATDGAGAEVAQVFSVTLGSYSQAAVARLQAEALAGRRPDVLFVVAPVEVDGQVLHRLLAGESEDARATALRRTLGELLPSEDPGEWVVRPTPLAFHLGTYPTLQEARVRAQTLHQREVPAYVLARSEGASEGIYDVWAGAYADSTEAAWLKRLLPVEEGRSPELRKREGALPR